MRPRGGGGRSRQGSLLIFALAAMIIVVFLTRVLVRFQSKRNEGTAEDRYESLAGMMARNSLDLALTIAELSTYTDGNEPMAFWRHRIRPFSDPATNALTNIFPFPDVDPATGAGAVFFTPPLDYPPLKDVKLHVSPYGPYNDINLPVTYPGFSSALANAVPHSNPTAYLPRPDYAPPCRFVTSTSSPKYDTRDYGPHGSAVDNPDWIPASEKNNGWSTAPGDVPCDDYWDDPLIGRNAEDRSERRIHGFEPDPGRFIGWWGPRNYQVDSGNPTPLTTSLDTAGVPHEETHQNNPGKLPPPSMILVRSYGKELRGYGYIWYAKTERNNLVFIVSGRIRKVFGSGASETISDEVGVSKTLIR